MTESAAIPDDAVFRVGPNVHTRMFGDELVVLDFACGEYFALDTVGTELWSQVIAGSSIREMATEIIARYDVSHSDALNDVRNFVGDLLTRRLIVVG